ncbi:MAG: uridine kinase [Ruminococcus sp.]|nr:nucleoside kinase [Ruminococcus sp.]
MIQQALSAINTAISENPAAYARQVDEAYSRQLLTIARQIYNTREEKPIILLAGPSGSGKTTTAMMLERILDDWGAETHTLSMDHYFRTFTPEEIQQATEGKIDLESPDRLDLPFLNQQLLQIFQGQPTQLPKYRFRDSKRIDSGVTLTRKPGELVILEGIHALNPAVVTEANSHIVRIYVSVRTRITDGTSVLQPYFLRLLRRMIRDRLFRHRSLSATLEMLEHVEAGEQHYIMPYKKYADLEVDSFHAYELGIYKQLLEADILQLDASPEQKTLCAFLQQATAFPVEQVPKESLVREFIGDGIFTY